MTSATAPIWAFWPTQTEAPATTGPKRKPCRAPVFIHDAVIPWRGETMLLTLLRQQAEEEDDQP